MRDTTRSLLLVYLSLARFAWAEPAADDWQAVVALDAGPQMKARTLQEARAGASAHLVRQERALRGFLAAHPEDEHVFEAKLRLVRLLEIKSGFEGVERARGEAATLLADLEKTASPQQRVEVDFAKVTRLMRGAQKEPAGLRELLLAASRRFALEHAGDRRVAPLLVEVATLFDAKPKIKEELLADASAANPDPGTKGRIADDLRRLGLLGKTLELNFTSVQGKAFKLADYRGKLVVVVFFAEFSPPAMEALHKVQGALGELPQGSAAAVGVDLDSKREALDAVVKTNGLTWPIAFDGKGWEGELVRGFGVNALPTVWIVDKQGRLRVLNGLDDTAEQLRRLQRE